MKSNTSSVSVLDHGYVTLVETWGSDISIIQAARMSTDKGFLGWEPVFAYVCSNSQCETGYSCERPNRLEDPACPVCESPMVLDEAKTHRGDKGLLAYLYRHKHMTPFEMAGMCLEVQAPIFVFREWHRHRTQSYNELSARYTPLPDLNYIPTVERLMIKSSDNRQASGTGAELTREAAGGFQLRLQVEYERQEALYRCALASGVPKELARLVLPVGRYSRMRAQANLRNWLQFLALRDHKDAQWEIQQYAKVVADFVEQTFPRTFALYKESV